MQTQRAPTGKKKKALSGGRERKVTNEEPVLWGKQEDPSTFDQGKKEHS